MRQVSSAKEIPDRLILSVVESLGKKMGGEREYRWAFRWDIEESLRLNGIDAPEKVVLAKLAKLVKRGVLDGCANCMCRGDYWVKDTSVLPLDDVPVKNLYT